MPVRSDLTLELREMFAGEISGLENLRHDSDGISVTTVNIKTEEAAKKIGKPVGSYVTIEIRDLSLPDDRVFERATEAVRQQLKNIIQLSDETSVLVVGLGNQNITPDSIGPKTVNKLIVTRHISKKADSGFNFSLRPVSAIAPGVLGITGLETGEVIRGVAEHVKPDLIIAVDALAARSLRRLGTTVQISDTGITPGSGVGNHRKALNEETLGVKVIAIGVPMVVDAATMAIDVLETVSGNTDERKRENEMKKLNLPEDNNLLVTPNDVDIISEQASDIIAEALNRVLHQ